MTELEVPKQCPNCGGRLINCVADQHPGDVFYLLALQGRVVLPGNQIGQNHPQWNCRECGFDWGDSRNDQAVAKR